PPPSSPSIYTLSLHDALPILSRLIEERVYDIAAVLALEVGKNRLEALAETQETADFFSLYAADFERSGAFDRPLPDDPLTTHASDRKSTRLNSSHRTISYAVF